MGGTSSRYLALLGIVAGVGWVASCEPASADTSSARSGTKATPARLDVPSLANANNVARVAARCSECHEDMTEQWRGSAHAKSAKSPAYATMRSKVPAASASACDRCHRPLASVVDPQWPVVAEGVTCDVCHSIAAVTVNKHSADFLLRLDNETKYGPYCDAKAHYFHKMGCSPLHTKSEMCASCHHLVENAHGADLPIYGEFAEWKAGPYADTMSCQDCHMELVPGEVAVGWDPPRPGVNHHSMMGEKFELRRRAVALSASLRQVGQKLQLRVEVKNTGAGHPIPNGLPARRLVVSASVRSMGGDAVSHVEVELGRMLHDADGALAPFYSAVRVASDSRIAPDSTGVVELELDAQATGELVVAVAWRPFAKDIAALLELDSLPDQELARGHFVLAKPGSASAFVLETKTAPAP